ncbi:hypothetical protein SDC9_188956 [bioreactor metagenome]|uniref:Uncharacterized protein n=1 Tax=bioreactor metagenome TaxID=1076179 RepID=A0A645HRB7_9ZZZZ
MPRHLRIGLMPHRERCGVQTSVGGVTLWRRSQKGYRLGEVDARLGQPDHFDSPGGSCGHHQRHGLCVSDVLGGGDHNPSCDEFRVFPGFQHLGQPVTGRIRV